MKASIKYSNKLYSSNFAIHNITPHTIYSTIICIEPPINIISPGYEHIKWDKAYYKDVIFEFPNEELEFSKLLLIHSVI